MIKCFNIEDCFAIKIETQEDGNQKYVDVADTINIELEEINRQQHKLYSPRVRVINIETIYDTQTVKVWYEIFNDCLKP